MTSHPHIPWSHIHPLDWIYLAGIQSLYKLVMLAKDFFFVNVTSKWWEADESIMNWARTADRFARANHLPRSRLSISCVMNVQSCHSYSGFLFVHARKDEKERKLHLSHARVAQVEDLFNMFRLSGRTDPYLIWCYQDFDTLVFVLKQYCFHIPFTERKPIIKWHVQSLLSFLHMKDSMTWFTDAISWLAFGSWISYSRLRLLLLE